MTQCKVKQTSLLVQHQTKICFLGYTLQKDCLDTEVIMESQYVFVAD
jgi:hypothetical protein